MNKAKNVLAQLIEIPNNSKFRHLFDKYDGNCYMKHFICWNQLLGNWVIDCLCIVVAFEEHIAKQYNLVLGLSLSGNHNRDFLCNRKLNTLNLHIFVSNQNPYGHFSTV